MSYIALSEVSHSYGGQALLEAVSLSLEANSRIGLVGRNGTGKTTLLEIIAGHVTPSSGVVHAARDRSIAYLTQEPDLGDNDTIHECVFSARPELIAAWEELEDAEDAISANPDEANLLRFEKAENDFQSLGGWEYEQEIRVVLVNLGLAHIDPKRRIAQCSGGEKTRVQLARILLSPFDVLLLDEPTNHLDFRMILWLETYLTGQSKPYLIISHDRHFLDRTVTKIVELRERRLTVYHGNYSFYLEEAERRIELQEKKFEQQQRLIRKTEDFIRKNMAGQKVKQAKSRIKMLDRMERIDKPREDKTFTWRIESSGRSGNDVFRIHNGRYGFGERILARDIDVEAFYLDRIGIVGENGCGKSTLLRIFAGEIGLTSGQFYRGASLRVGYYDQEHIRLNQGLTVLDTIWGLCRGEPQGVPMSYLARFGFTGDALLKTVEVLSGGETARLYIAKLIFEKPNLLLLDEPTNHLDLDTIETLEEALANYDGTVIFVSHDLYFIQNLAERIWYFSDYTLTDTDLTPEQIHAVALQKKRSARPREEQAAVEKTRAKRINPQVLERMLAGISNKETEITGWETKIADWQEQYALPETYRDADKVRELQQSIRTGQDTVAELRVALETLETEYLEMSQGE
jgi:ATP-binding cassette, subfamily F, member 3